MAEKTLFRVTDAAGPYVAGRKVKIGDVIPLTSAQAEYELQRGVIAPHGSIPPLRTPEDGGAVDLVTRGVDGGARRSKR